MTISHCEPARSCSHARLILPTRRRRRRRADAWRLFLSFLDLATSPIEFGSRVAFKSRAHSPSRAANQQAACSSRWPRRRRPSVTRTLLWAPGLRGAEHARRPGRASEFEGYFVAGLALIDVCRLLQVAASGANGASDAPSWTRPSQGGCNLRQRQQRGQLLSARRKDSEARETTTT